MRSTRDDLRDAVRPDRRRQQQKLTAFAVVAWRFVVVIVAILVVGGLAELLS